MKINTHTHTPASTSFSLFSIGQANPLGCHGADVVVGIKVSLLYLASINHINNIIYGDAVRKSGNKERERKEKKMTVQILWTEKKNTSKQPAKKNLVTHNHSEV